jgi:hypothetical protein
MRRRFWKNLDSGSAAIEFDVTSRLGATVSSERKSFGPPQEATPVAMGTEDRRNKLGSGVVIKSRCNKSRGRIGPSERSQVLLLAALFCPAASHGNLEPMRCNCNALTSKSIFGAPQAPSATCRCVQSADDTITADVRSQAQGNDFRDWRPRPLPWTRNSAFNDPKLDPSWATGRRHI